MAILSGIFGILGRFAGRVLNAVLGWATILLFGKGRARPRWRHAGPRTAATAVRAGGSPGRP